MLKRTTNYLFQTFGSVFYDMKSAGQNSATISNTIQIDNKSFDSYYYSSTSVYLSCQSGIVMMVVSKDGINYSEFVIHRVIRLNPGVYFNFVSISNTSKIHIAYAPTGLNQKKMKVPYIYERIVSKIDLKEILTCFYQVRKSNYDFPGESHDFYELTYIDHGSLHMTIDGKPYQLNKYDLIIYYPGQFHTQSTDEHSTCSYLTITFDMKNDMDASLMNRVFKTRKDIYNVLSAFMKAIQSKEYLSEELALLYLKEVLILLYQFDTKSDEESNINPMQEHYENTLLNEILVFIHNNLFTAFTVEDLCQKFSISRSSLQTLFRSNINITPKHYISNLKLNQAKLLIQEHKYTISEISDMLGFTSIHYFSRKFKLQYGMSPTDYAKSINQ
ncbi:AraC family transcriptional regulator [Faecalicoccus acidiformans]|uniref:AraC family transcriptional regulator n=1 Tax=Faecalicoccus acidiformans TaxID=915173 RepID=UPI0025A469EF|nr:AraC family transcriptional regulator [Faecalicoccus acidiformans]MDM8202839.1 AraC family transcriptional regulator [Faecalicoccus acidiformans]